MVGIITVIACLHEAIVAAIASCKHRVILLAASLFVTPKIMKMGNTWQSYRVNIKGCFFLCCHTM